MFVPCYQLTPKKSHLKEWLFPGSLESSSFVSDSKPAQQSTQTVRNKSILTYTNSTIIIKTTLALVIAIWSTSEIPLIVYSLEIGQINLYSFAFIHVWLVKKKRASGCTWTIRSSAELVQSLSFEIHSIRRDAFECVLLVNFRSYTTHHNILVITYILYSRP